MQKMGQELSISGTGNERTKMLAHDEIIICWPSNIHWNWTIFATFYSFFSTEGGYSTKTGIPGGEVHWGPSSWFLPQVVGELIGIDSGEHIVFISFQLCVQWGHIHGLKSVTLGVCTPAKLANVTNQNFSLSESQLLNIYSHSTPYTPHLTHQCVMQILSNILWTVLFPSPSPSTECNRLPPGLSAVAS